MRRRIIVRAKNQNPIERNPRGRQKLSENQKWRNNLGKRGMFQWGVKIVEKYGDSTEQVISTDSYDDAKAWAGFKCKEGMTIFIDGQEIIRR